ncbi:fatty-acid amide hydrolase 2-like [Linepithema humile]|uniref:fatty-acid amide hydrolase 2-like n=1 Tax=Linepithema humile TaxID=83485 RepID=UPI0006239B69|nr:PREDICTED: fatty-acid amide hydrolase 2-like [Linepithema humile]
MLLKVRVPFSIVNVVHRVLNWIFLFVYKKSSQNIPPATNPLFTLSATTLAKKIRQREITSYEVVNEYIERIKEVNRHLNAVVDNRFEDAIIEAKICDEQLKTEKFDTETLEKEKPLFGVPLTIKEAIAVKGCSYTGGILNRKEIKATYDAPIIELIRNSGGILVCVTNTPEWCSGLDTMNPLYGRTYNAYDNRFTVGGSSGGEAALLGAGASLIGIGSDLAGSIRLPAMFNGIFGFKPTAGIIPTEGHLPRCEDIAYLKLLNLGPMTRYAEDLDLLMKALTSKCEHNLRLDVPVDLKQLKVYYLQALDNTLGLLPISSEIKECILMAANHFKNHNIHTEQLPIEWPTTVIEITLAALFSVKDTYSLLKDINDPMIYKYIITEFGKSLLGMSSYTKQMLFNSMILQKRVPFSTSDLSYYTKKGELLRQKLLDLLGENGVFICPTFRSSEIFANLILCESLNAAYCAIFNVLGFPAIQVPMGLNRDGLPIGVQVIAAPYQDRLCLVVAKELESAFGGWTPPSAAVVQ